MFEALKSNVNKKPRILLLSLRNLKLHVSRCYSYELEDAICEFDSVDMLAPVFSPSLFKVTNRLANYATKAIGNSKLVSPILNQSSVDKEYDLFFVICQSPFDILCLNSIKGWRKKCRQAVIWLDEIWAKDINNWRVQLKLLKDFDHIFMNLSHSMSGVAEIVQRPCHFIPFGTDALQFCPYPLPPERSIDIYSIGRRSQVTHKALLDFASQGNFFYMYETIKDLYMIDYNYHRSLYRNLVKRSRYFIANKAKFNSLNETGGQEEISSRFFEGAAGGAVILGVPPADETFNQYFNWQDAVIPIPYDAANITDTINEMDSQPERLKKIRVDNVVNSLLRHDWVYRWGKILDTVELERTPEMVAREASLQKLAKMIVAPQSSVQKPEDISAHTLVQV